MANEVHMCPTEVMCSGPNLEEKKMSPLQVLCSSNFYGFNVQRLTCMKSVASLAKQATPVTRKVVNYCS